MRLDPTIRSLPSAGSSVSHQFTHKPIGTNTHRQQRKSKEVMAHELAHCKHMNHGPSFQKTNTTYLKAVLASLAAGFTGVGFWGKGNTIAGGDVSRPIVEGDLPEFTWSVLSTLRSLW